MEKLERDIRNSVIAAIAVSVLIVIMSVIRKDPYPLIDAAIIFTSAFFVVLRRSRIASTVMFLDIAIGILVVLVSDIRYIGPVILPGIVAYFMWKGMIATYKLPRTILQ